MVLFTPKICAFIVEQYLGQLIVNFPSLWACSDSLLDRTVHQHWTVKVIKDWSAATQHIRITQYSVERTLITLTMFSCNMSDTQPITSVLLNMSNNVNDLLLACDTGVRLCLWYTVLMKPQPVPNQGTNGYLISIYQRKKIIGHGRLWEDQGRFSKPASVWGKNQVSSPAHLVLTNMTYK